MTTKTKSVKVNQRKLEKAIFGEADNYREAYEISKAKWDILKNLQYGSVINQELKNGSNYIGSSLELAARPCGFCTLIDGSSCKECPVKIGCDKIIQLIGEENYPLREDYDLAVEIALETLEAFKELHLY